MSDAMPDYAVRLDRVAVASVSASATRIRHTGHVEFKQHDIVFVPRTGECLWVLRATPKTIVVRRGVGSEPAPLKRDDELLIIGSAS